MMILDRLLGSLIFGLFYMLMYSMPVAVIFLVVGSPDGPAEVVFGVLGFASLVFAAYRTKFAVGALVEEMTFREAHRTSRTMVRTNLSFLPVVGRFFRNPKDGTTDD